MNCTVPFALSSLTKNSRARALPEDMGRARKKKYGCANFELKQERTAAMFRFENTNPPNIFFSIEMCQRLFESSSICGLVNVQ